MRPIFLFFALALSSTALAQVYPQQYFRNPLNIPILLAGNFGECRPGHFHSGIDIKTQAKENLPVYAAAAGYISRVKMEPGGFGHAIYMTHPNGYTTLYAHLNNFFPALQQLVHNTQYQNKNWELDLKFDSSKFVIRKGQQIAWSGNTGGSTAPHLHFEIRNTSTEHPLNPQLFGFKIVDKLSPIPSEIAFYNAAKSVYEQTPLRLRLKKKAGLYTTPQDTILIQADSINIGVAVHDFMENSSNTLSIYTAQWYANDSMIGNLSLDDIGYDATRYLNACADYKIKYRSGVWLNSLFLLPNNKLSSIYQLRPNSHGSITLKKDATTKVKILLKDVYGNSTELVFWVQAEQSSTDKGCTTLWTAAQANSIKHPNLQLELPAAALYDNICFEFSSKTASDKASAIWQLHDPAVPIHLYTPLSIKPDKAVPFAYSNKMVLCYTDGKRYSGKAALLNDGWYTASMRAFGTYWLAIDSTAPSIKSLIKNGEQLGHRKQIGFMITDNLTSIKHVEGFVNQEWVCFEQHGDYWFYTLDEHCPKGKFSLSLSATDESDNSQKMQFTFIR